MIPVNRSQVSERPAADNIYVDGILWGGARWSSNKITYSFNSGNDLRQTRDWSAGEIEVMEAVLATWSAVADLEFARVADDNTDANFKLNLGGDFEENIYARFAPPGERNQGEGYFNRELMGGSDFKELQPGSLGFLVLVHEIGHGLGLAHPHDDAGGSDLYPGLYAGLDPEDSVGANGLNQGVWTTMSYNQGLNGFGVQGSPMTFDIAAIQHLYGANDNFADEDNTYTLDNRDTTETHYRGIWDTDGEDTIRAVPLSADATIDLRAATLEGKNAAGYISSVDDIDGGFTIANGVEIENALGGLGNDTLTGNSLENRLSGSGGDDRLTGGDKTDTLLGGTGNDTLIGADLTEIAAGRGEYDRLTGGAGADVFVLGDSLKAHYLGNGFATVTDFDSSEGDRLRAYGLASDYDFQTAESGGIHVIYRGNRLAHVLGEEELTTALDFDFV